MSKAAQQELLHADAPTTAPEPAASSLPAPVQDAAVITPMAMVSRALEMGVSAEILKQMMDLRDREEARSARMAFTRAVSAAKAELKPIMKTREVDYTPQGKPRVNYRHEDLAGIEAQVTPILTKYGLSYRFESDNGVDRPITITCVLEHVDGHSTRTPLSAGADNGAGKNSLQAIASAATYLQRYTLKLALGLSVSHDDDGKGAVIEGVATLSEKQIDDIRDLMTEHGKTEAALLKWQKVERIEEIPAANFDAIIAQIKTPKVKP